MDGALLTHNFAKIECSFVKVIATAGFTYVTPYW